MTQAVAFAAFDDTDKIKDLMDSTPPKPLKALEAEYEIALSMLVARLPMGMSIANEHEEKMAQRLARHFLFNYNTGFSLLKFVPAYDRARKPTARQVALEESIQKLAQLDAARDVMDEWFSAAIERRLHQTLRDFLNAGKPTLNPRRVVSRTAAQIGLSNDLEVVGRMSGSVYKTMDFGVSGFYLIFKSTGTIRSQEFEALLGYARNTFTKYRQDNVPSLAEVARVLAVPDLSPEQIDELIRFVVSIPSREEFPLSDRDDAAIDPMTRVDQVSQNMGFSAPIRFVIKLIAKIFEKQLREEARRSREIQKELHPHPDQEELAARRSMAIKVARILSNHSNLFLTALEESDLLAGQSGEPSSYSKSGSWFDKDILSDTLVSALQYLPSLRILSNQLQTEPNVGLAEETLQALRDSNMVIEKSAVGFLIEMIRDQKNPARWVRQVFENLPGISEPAERLLAHITQSEENQTVLKVLIRLHENLALHQHFPTVDLKSALVKRMTDLLMNEKVVPDPEWLAWFVGLGREHLRRLLMQISSTWPDDPSSSLFIHNERILHELSFQAERLSTIDAITLAACWLVEPDDWMKSGTSLLDRVRLAIRYLVAGDTDRSVEEAIANVFKNAIIRRSNAHYVLATALRTMHSPDLALPLLQLLLEMALNEEQGTWNWRTTQETGRKLLSETVKSIAAFSPLTPQAIYLLERLLFANQGSEAEGIRELTPAFVYDELLPLLAHEVASDAVPVLIELVWKNQCAPLVEGESPCVRRDGEFFLDKFEHPTWHLPVEEKIHRYLHIYQQEGYYPEGKMLLCALQALANVDSLGLPEQRLIWRVYRTSWHALTKSLCLLILGRQRPVQAKIIQELIRLLHRSPTTELWKMLVKHSFRSLLFRFINHSSPPESDFNYLYLCQSVAVDMISSLLKQESDNPLVTQYRSKLEQALIQTTDLFRYGMEPHMSAFTSMGSSTTGTGGIAKIIGASQQEENQLTWMAQPADRAYHALHELISWQLL